MWRIIAEEVDARRKVLQEELQATGGWISLATHPELVPFLRDEQGMPLPADLPPLKQMATEGGFGEFYTAYRMISRRAHPNLDAARSRLTWNGETGAFAPLSSLAAVELGNPYADLCIYVVAKFGMLVDERLRWGRADRLHEILDEMTTRARTTLEEAEANAGDDPDGG
jgi:hypothetical protein